MPRQNITAYDLLISCPGDVIKYAQVVKECIESFNVTIGRINSTEIVGMHWSTSSYAQSGDKPQEILNKQFVRDCDAAVAIFWTRFGTPTEKYGSGTEEEIEEMLMADKQVFMYFVAEPVDLNTVDLEQYKKVQAFKERIGEKALYYQVSDVEDFRKNFTNHLSMHFLPKIIGDKEVTNVIKKESKLKIYDYENLKGSQVSILCSDYLNSRFLSKIENRIISQIMDAQKLVLPIRDGEGAVLEKKSIVEGNIDTQNNEVELLEKKDNDLDLQKFDFFKSLISDAEIKEEWKECILSFANRKNIEIDNSFWSTGNLKIKKSMLDPMFGGGISFDGSDEEKKHYNDIEDIFVLIQELNEYRDYFEKIDRYRVVQLVLANDGTTYDEDIDVKLYVKKGSIVKKTDLPIPGSLIIDDVNDMNFIKTVFREKETEKISEYADYPLLQPRISEYLLNASFSKTSADEEYENSKDKYADFINQTFCYEMFENENEDIIVIHFGYLKHNAKMAFPSLLVFVNSPDTILYEITSKYSPEVIKGELILS